MPDKLSNDLIRQMEKNQREEWRSTLKLGVGVLVLAVFFLPIFVAFLFSRLLVLPFDFLEWGYKEVKKKLERLEED